MEVTNIKVSFMREKQPVQYEKAQPFVEFTATIEPGEDHQLVARQLMGNACSVVYAGIGYDVPDRVADKLSIPVAEGVSAIEGGNVKTEPAVEQKVAEVAAPAPVEPAPKAEVTAESFPGTDDEPAPKKRGRPAGSKNKTKVTEENASAQVEKAQDDQEADALATATEIASAAGQPEDDKVANISSGDEDRIDPAASEEDAGFTPEDFHALINTLVKASPRRLSVPKVHEVLAYFGVGRPRDLTNEQAAEAKVMVEQFVAEEEAKADA